VVLYSPMNSSTPFKYLTGELGDEANLRETLRLPSFTGRQCRGPIAAMQSRAQRTGEAEGRGEGLRSARGEGGGGMIGY